MKYRYCTLSAMLLGGSLFLVPALAGQSPIAVPAEQERLDSTTLIRIERVDSQLLLRIDTLQAQLEKHRFAENFLDSALEEQANRFSLIIGALLTAVGLLTYQGFRHEIHRLHAEITNQINEQKAEIDAAISRVDQAELRLMSTSGNVHRTIAELYANRARYVAAFQHSFTAAGFFYNRYKLASNKTEADALRLRKAAIANLRLSMRLIEQLRVQNLAKTGAALQKSEHAIRRAFDRLNSPDDEEVQGFCAEIRVRLRVLRDAQRAGEAQSE
jgi:hypothetical protein